MSSVVHILITDKIAEEGLSLLKNDSSLQVDYSPGIKSKELFNKITSAEGLIIRTATTVNKELLSHGKKLKLVCRVGIGTDNIDVEACKKRGITVINTPQGNRVSTAEHAFALMLALARKIPQASENLKKGGWDREKFTGTQIQGKTLGIIGLGNIGKEVAKRAKAFGMKVMAYDPYIPQVEGLYPLNEVLAQSDFLSFHVPLTEETRGMVNRDFFKKIKKGAFLINTSRGAVVNEVALIETLNGGGLEGVALDVFVEEPLNNRELSAHPKIILTPHIAGQTKESMVALSQEAAHKVSEFFSKMS